MLFRIVKFVHFLLAGLSGWTKAAAHYDLANKKTIEKRKQICLKCPHVQIDKNSGQPRKCEICGCFLHAKLQLKDSRCPQDRW